MKCEYLKFILLLILFCSLLLEVDGKGKSGNWKKQDGNNGEGRKNSLKSKNKMETTIAVNLNHTTIQPKVMPGDRTMPHTSAMSDLVTKAMPVMLSPAVGEETSPASPLGVVSTNPSMHVATAEVSEDNGMHKLIDYIFYYDYEGAENITTTREPSKEIPTETSENRKGDITKTIRYEEEVSSEKVTLELVVGGKPKHPTDDSQATTAPADDAMDVMDGSSKVKCDRQSITDMVTKYYESGRIPLSKLLSLLAGKMTNLEKLRFVNATLVEFGLPPILNCGDNAKSTSAPTDAPEFTSIYAPMTDAAPRSDDCEQGKNITNLEELLSTVKEMEVAGLIPIGVTQKAVKGNIPLADLKRMVLEASVKDGRISPKCLEELQSGGRPPRVEKITQVRKKKLNQLYALMNAGYLPPDTMQRLIRGEITEQWLRANLTQNREYIMSLQPEAIRILMEKGKLPLDIEEAIFSGSHNKTEIFRMLIRDDNIIKALLPQKLLDMLQSRPVPLKLKLLILSGKNASEIQREVESDEELLQQLMSPSTYFFYELFKVEMNRNINIGISISVVVVLAFVMVSLGCTMTVTKIVEHAKKPKGVVIALFAQFVIMPASAFALTQAFDLEMYAAIAVLICGCCPGGNLSNMLAYSLSGDMNLSILMTTCSSILGLGFMPLSIYLYSRFIIPLDSGAIVPFDKIVINIALTVFPVGIGIAIRHYRPQWVRNVMRIGAAVLIVCTITVAVLSGIMLGDAFFVYFPLPVLACCAILPMAGYTLGYVFALVARENPKCRRTICVETGCQNVQLCGTVLKLAFDPILVGVLFLMPLVYMLFQVVEAFLMIMVFRLYNRLRGHKELVEEHSDEKKKSDLESGDDEKNVPAEEEQKTLLIEESPKDSTKSIETNQAKVENKSKDDDSDLVEIWPLEGEPTPAYLDSFKKAGTENFV